MPGTKYNKQHMTPKITDIYIDLKDGYVSWHIIVVRSELGENDSRYDVYSRYEKIEILKTVAVVLDSADPQFLDRFVETDSKAYSASPNRKRRYVSKEKSELYPTKDPEFADAHAWRLRDYWIGTNVGEKEIRQYLLEMGEAARVRIEFRDIKSVRII